MDGGLDVSMMTVQRQVSIRDPSAELLLRSL